MANSRRNRRLKPTWDKSLVRTILLYAGATALICWVVLLGIAVFTEPASDDFSGTWLAVATIAAFLAVLTVLSLLVTHPGLVSGVAGAAAAVVAGVGAVLIYVTMPVPGIEAFITHRHALAALAFGFGVLGGGLLLLGELAGEGEQKAPTLTQYRASLGAVASVVVLVAAGMGVPTMHRWADSANTEASRAEKAAPASTELTLETVSPTMRGHVQAATPGGLLTIDEDDEGSAVAVTMRDATSGAERWHHRRWNREATQAPVLSADGTRIALAGKRRDDTTLQYVTILDSSTGKVTADVPFDGPPGELEFITDTAMLHISGAEQQVITLRNLSGKVLWDYQVDSGCVATTTLPAGDLVTVALACRVDAGTEDQAHVVALDAVSGGQVWDWASEAEGRIHPGGMIVAPGKVIVDVRHDDSPNDGLFAARMYRHDLNAIMVDTGKSDWRNEDLDLGNTYAPACVATLQLAGVPVGSGGEDLETAAAVDARVVLGECHQIPGTAGATLDLVSYAVDDGKRVLETQANLGYSPTRDEDTTGWFLGLPDGRVLMTVDASLDSADPSCRLYVAGPSEEQEKPERLPVPEAIEDTGWCRQAALGMSPEGLTVSYALDDQRRFFSLR